MYEVGDEPRLVSGDWNLAVCGKEKTDRNPDSSPAVHLRGGAASRQTGFLGWLIKDHGTQQKLDKGKGKESSSFVTYKGMRIGSPHPTSALDVLPPASRYVRQPQDHLILTSVPKSPLKNGYDINGNHLPTPPLLDFHAQPHSKSPPLSPPPALFAASARHATTNPFADIYCNPNVVRVRPASPSIDYAAAGSLVERPSALDGSQIGYLEAPVLSRRSLRRDTNQIMKGASIAQVADVKTYPQNARAPAEKAPEQPSRNSTAEKVEDDEGELFDTGRVLNSLRPERLGLPPIGSPRRTENSHLRADPQTGSRPTPAVHAEQVANPDGFKAGDNYSIRTRAWELQSCATDDLSVDSQLKRQEQLAQCIKRRAVAQDQRQENNIRINEEPLDGLPEENAQAPEDFFYAELIDIAGNYHEQQRMIQRAFEAGEMSEEHWRREKWKHGTAMDKNMRAAAEMSGYKVSRIARDVDGDIGYQ